MAIRKLATRRGAPVFLLLGLLPGLGALTAPLLLGYDDNWGTTHNPLIVHGFGYFWQQLALPFGPQERVGFETGHWAPLSYLSLALDHTVFGHGSGNTLPQDFVPWGFRLINGFIHGICGWFVLRLALKLWVPRTSGSSLVRAAVTPPEIAAFFAALFFLFHPTVCETICWVIERNNLVPALFGLWALDVYTSGNAAEPSWTRTLCAAFLLLLSQLGKASGVSWWPVLVGWEFLLLRPPHAQRSFARALILLLPIILSVAVLLESHADVLMLPLGKPPFGPWLMSGYLLLRYAALLLWPIHLSAFYHISPTGVPFGAWQTWTTLLAVLAVLACAWKAEIPRARLALYGLWIAAAVAPIINPFVNTSFLLQDRYLYPALPAFGCLVAELLFCGLPRLRISALVASGLVILLLLGSISRSYVWVNEETLFRNAAKTEPNSAFGHIYLANHLFQSAAEVPDEKQRELRLDESLREHALAARCDDFDRLQWPLHYLTEQATILLHKHDTGGARKIFLQVWQTPRPERPSERGAKLYAIRFLAFDALQAGHDEEGLIYIERGLQIDPDDAELLLNRLRCWAKLKRFDLIRSERERLSAKPELAAQATQLLDEAQRSINQ